MSMTRATLSYALRELKQHHRQLQASPRFSEAFRDRPRRPCVGSYFCYKQQLLFLSNHVRNLDDVQQGNYFDPPYWDSIYTSDHRPLEWYQSYSEISPLLKRYIPFRSRVLMSGCGNSEFSVDMVKDGFNEIINIDISSVVIDSMKKKYKNVPQLKYMTMDVLQMSSFENDSFDCVIDKGTLDAIMCLEGGPYNIAMMLAEIARVLKAGGVYMLVSFAGPHLSLSLLNRYAFGWSIDCYVLYKEDVGNEGGQAFSEPILLDIENVNIEKEPVKPSDSLYIYMCRKLIPH